MDQPIPKYTRKTFSQYNLYKNHREFEILAMAMHHASDSMIVTDRYNNILKVNRAFLKTFGYNEQEIIGKNTVFLHTPKCDPSLYHQMWNTILRKKHFSNELWSRRKNGDIFPTWVSISAITDEHHKIQNYLAIFTDLTELRKSQEISMKLAYYDQLTGLPNRQKIVSDMQQRNPSVCIVFNIDNFKEINDFYGIEIGDSVLTRVGQWFKEMNFSPYRISGDEFAVLLYENLSWNDLRNRITALMTLLEEKVFLIHGEAISIQMTVGAAIGHQKLLTRADIALNRAKKMKTSLALYDEQDNVENMYRHNMKMTAIIRHALNHHGILCYYQPIVDISTGTISKYEALVRMKDQQNQIINPNDFLTIAKKAKLYPLITIAVIQQACEIFSDRDEEFSINLSDTDIRNPYIVNEIIHIITKTRTANRIVFEILESEGIENYDDVVKFIASVKHLGAKIAIDDFGTGYSNFENILKLNVDYIKIDGSLIQGICDNERHRIVVETIIAFALKIGAKTIAEFVSTEDTYALLKTLGVDYSQGYFTGKPQSLIS